MTRDVKDSRTKTKQQSKQVTLRVRMTIKLDGCCWTGKKESKPRKSWGNGNSKEMKNIYDKIKMVVWREMGYKT